MKERLSVLMASALLWMFIARYQHSTLQTQHVSMQSYGLRGHKDVITDLDDAIDSLNKMKTYLEQTK